MNNYKNSVKDYVGYDYKQAIVEHSKVSMYVDVYQNFGWSLDENVQTTGNESRALSLSPGVTGRTIIKLKRDRKIINKTELTRLQRHFEACMDDIESLEKSKTSTASMVSLIIGFIGTAFIAGATIAFTSDPPIIWLCVLLALPGFTGWILPYFVNQKLVNNRTKAINPRIEQKYDEIYELCEKGSKLLCIREI